MSVSTTGRVWSAALDVATDSSRFDVGDVHDAVDGDVSRETVRRRLVEMTALDWLTHRDGSPYWRSGPRLREIGSDSPTTPPAGAGAQQQIRGSTSSTTRIDDAGDVALAIEDEPVDEDDDPDVGVPDDVREDLRDELPGSGDRLEARVDAILAMRDELRERGTAEKDDLRAVVDPAEVGYQDRVSVWSNMVKGKDTLRALPDVEAPDEGGRTWCWVGNGGGR